MKRFGAVPLALVLMATAVAPAMAADSRPDQVVDRFFDAYRRGAVEEMLALYAPGALFEDVNQRHRIEGTEQLREFLARIVRMHTTIGLSETRRATTGNTVVVQYAYTGTLSGAALRAITGKETCRDTEFTLPVTSWYEIEDGRIARQTDFIDLATLREIQARASGATPEVAEGS